MASSPYLSERVIGCFKGCPIPCKDPSFDPACNVDPCKQIQRDRWNVLRDDVCNRGTLKNPCETLGNSLQNLTAICKSPHWGKFESQYKQDFKYPRSHNVVDDCCTTPCPCVDTFPELPGNLHYRCTIPKPCDPLDDLTTYDSYFVPHPPQPRPTKRVQHYDPCPCPMERCTITRTDYTAKEPIPTGPACSEVIKHGLWSTEQFCKEFTDDTTTGEAFGKKCAERRKAFKEVPNLRILKCPSVSNTTNRDDYTSKGIPDDPCYPDWISNDVWYAPETNMERCTTYKHFYQPYDIPTPLRSLKVGSPGAIPYCTLNKVCYSCYDPTPEQKTPVELRDNDPWPYVKPCPIKYQNNLYTDPCAAFCDDTVYKCDYIPKALCRPNENFAPLNGFVPPLIPFNDNTTMKMSYPAYNWCQYKEAFGNAGNPNGTNYGPFTCPPETDKCLPRFPAPYGNPLKPYLTPCRCPCGPFDNRSTYNTAFQFRSPEVVKSNEMEMCRVPNVPKGVSLYRHDYVPQGGKKAAVMPPPPSKGYRCLHPCERRDADTLYRIDYHNFWESMERPSLELYRGHPTIRTRRQAESMDGEEEQEVLYTPVFVRPSKASDSVRLPAQDPVEYVNLQSPEYQKCRTVPYSGENILNRANDTEVCSGYM